MAERNISNSALRTALINGDPFEYAHLVKFERPFVPLKGKFRTNANRYVYLTDGQRDVTFDGDVYRASGLQNVSAYSETTQARATKMSLTLPGEFLGTEVTVVATFATNGKITATSQLGSDLNDTIDFFEEGFREGDKVRVTKGNSTNFSDGDNQKDFIITGFETNNTVLVLARTGTDTDDSAFLSTALTNTQIKISLINEEYKAATMEKGTFAEVATTADGTTSITLTSSNSLIEKGQLVSGTGVLDETIVKSINGTTLTLSKEQPRIPSGTKLSFTNPSFVNREVFIYKAYFNPETGAMYGDPILTFKGITASCSLQEAPNSSKVQWSLSSHWGDFEEIRGRLTTDELHRALDANGKPNSDLTIRPEYASDLGFLHAETSLNTIAIYQTSETRTRMKKKKRGGLAGLLGGKKYYMEEYQVLVDNEVDLNVHLQGKHLPVVYGVQRVEGTPVFADTKKNNSKEVYVLYTLAEGQIHGIYNMYIDGAPLICIDEPDFEVRNASTGTDKDNTQLQCYGRADQGSTLSGGNVTTSTSDTYIDYDDDEYYEDFEDNSNNTRYSSYDRSVQNRVRRYQNFNENSIQTLTTSADAEGLRHRETASISHPYNMHFTFYQGKPNQKGDNNLTTIAQANNFKRQADYYDGQKSYWSPEHKLLDTAYAVMKFTIDADQTTIPEVEYVIKGKVLENYNYDGTYVPDPAFSTANVHTNFKEGDSVTVEVSDNASSWSSDGGGTYRILDKYSFTPAEGSAYFRFRLDRVPSVGTKQYIRLKSGSNYWYMLGYNHELLGETTWPESDQIVSTNTLSTDSNGVLKATLTNTQKTKLLGLYPNITSSTTTSDAYIQFAGGKGIFGNLRKGLYRALLDSNELTFPATNFSANQTSNSGQDLNGTSILPATKFDFSNVSAVASLSDNTRIIGSTLEIVDTQEKRKIIGFDTSTNILEIEDSFITAPDSTMKFKITGRGADLRSSINPAIQLADMLTNARFGKDLSITEDIDLASIKESALLCDTRSDVTIPLASTASCVAGDVYKLVDGSGNHVASGKVLASTTASSSVTFTDVSGKFSRNYFDYISYNVGDIVTNVVNGVARYYRVTVAGFKATAPTHVSGTTNGFQFISSLSLSKVSGSGPSSLTFAVDGKGISYSLYDSDFVKYWRYLGWEENRQYAVTRHQTNFIFATERSIFENVNALLSHFNGILSYSNGKYVLSVETQESAPTSTITDGIEQNPEFITEDDIIGTISLNDNSQKNSKNTIKASINDPQNNFGSRAVSFFNSDFLKADKGKVKTGSFPFTGITSYYNARIGVEKELIQSRYSKEINFTVGPKGLLLKPGEVIAITYEPFGFESKLFRIENLNYQSNCLTTVKAREYNDTIYAITAQKASSAQKAATGGNYALEAPGAPTNLTTGSAKPGIITLNWTNATDYKETIDSTEIWRANTQGSSGSVPDHATLLTVVDNATTFNDAVGVAGTYFYWVRHRRVSRRTGDNSTVKLLSPYESNIDAGVSGVANVLSPQLDVDISSFQVKFNASNALTPGGASQDVTFTATLRNITASNVTFTLVDADGSTTATDGVVFTNNSTSVVDSSAPFTATLDASSFSHNTSNKFVKVTTSDSGTSESFTELIPITVTKDGSSGSIGSDAKAIKLTPSSHVVSYTATGGETTTVNFTTAIQGTSSFSGTPNYKFLVAGQEKQSGTTSTFTLADSDEPAAEATVNVTVQLFDGTPSGSPEAIDTVTIFGVKSGSDSITAFLTNNSHTVSANPDGSLASGALDDAGGTFKIFVGTTDKTTSCSFTEVSGQETSGLTSAINSSTGVYEITGLTVDSAVNIFRATIPANQSPTGNSITIDQTYSISKSRTGQVGSAGSNAKTVRLTSGGYAIVYDSSGSNPSPSGTLTLTATATNFTDPYFKFTGDGFTDETSYTDGSGATDTLSYTIPSSFFSTPKLIRVGVSEADNSSTEVAFDSINLTAVKDGVSGADAITAIVTNEAHTLPANSSGTVSSFANSGTDIQVFKGATELNGITSGTPSTGEFKVIATASNISTGNISSPGNPVVVANHSNMTADTATISYAINVENSLTLTKKQTFSKSKEGAAGTDSLSGVLTNENASASQFGGFLGIGSFLGYTGTGGEFKVFEGSSEKTSGVTFGISGGTAGGSTTTKTQNGLTLTINNSTGVYSLAGISWSTELETFTLTATVGSTTIEKIYNIDKKSLFTITNLVASEQAFAYDEGSANPSPSSITLTASAPTTFNTFPSGNYQYQFEKSTDGGQNFSVVSAFSTTGNLSDRQLSVSAGNFNLGNEVFKVKVRHSSNSSVILDEDQTTLIRIKEGDAGSDGTQTANVQVYKRTTTNSAPNKPGNGSTFTFSTGALTGQAITDGWTQTVPTGTAQYLWTCNTAITATATTTSVTVNQGDWSTVVLQSEAQVARVVTKRIYYNAWNFGDTLPSITNTQRDSITYNFDTGACGNLPSGWSTGIGIIPYAYVDVTFSESSYEGSYTRSLGDVRTVGGKWERIDITDIKLSFDSDNKIRIRAGETGLGVTDFQEEDIPGGLKNSGISLSKQGSAIRLTNTGSATDITLAKADVGLPNVVDGADVTSANTSADTSAVNGTAAATVSGGATRANTGLDSSGRLQTSIIDSGTVVSVADLKNTKVRTFGAIDGNNRVIGSIFDGSTLFSPAELLRVRAGFDNISSGTLTLKSAQLPTIPVSKGGTGATTAAGARSAIGAGTSNFNGQYSSLSGLPTIPTPGSGANNFLPGNTTIPTAVSDLTNDSGFTTFDGNFNSLTNKPTIPTAVSDLTNDSGFLTGITGTLIDNAGGVLDSSLTFGNLSFTSGGVCSFFSSNNGSTFTTTNATGEISITHPTLGTFACNYTFTKNSSNQISSFTLTNTGTGNDAFTSSSFGSAAASKSITVTHTASSKTIVCFASVTVFNSGSGGGGPGGGSCFISGTKVGLPNKEEKEIQKVEIGDYVLTENEHDEVDGIAKVLNKGSIKVDSYYYINQELGLTAGHPIWVEDKGWACIDPGEYYKECKLLNHVIDLEPVELEIGDKTTNGKIEIINKIEEEQEVWWITVDNTHTYYVNGILVHNGAKP